MTTPIKSTLECLTVGQITTFPISRRKSVRTTASDLKLDKGFVYSTKMNEGNIIVKREK